MSKMDKTDKERDTGYDLFCLGIVLCWVPFFFANNMKVPDFFGVNSEWLGAFIGVGVILFAYFIGRKGV
jgi:hypothetical protein